MRAYRETFRQHRLLYLLPALLAVIAVGGIEFKAPKKYQSTGSVWVDNEATSTSSLDVSPTSSQAQPPSSVEQTLLDELIVTTRFDDAVVAAAGLGHAAANGTSSPLVASIPTGVVASTPGPQVLQVTYTGSSPVVAQKIVQSLVSELQTFTQQFVRKFQQAAIAYDETQQASAVHTLASAKQAVTAFQSSHPGASTQNSPEYASLVAALTSSTASLNAASTTLAQSEAQSQASADGPTVSGLGEPTFNPAPMSGKKKVVEYAFGAGVVALLLSFLVIVVITAGGEDKWDEEVSGHGEDMDPRVPLPSGGDRVAARRTPVVIRGTTASSRLDKQRPQISRAGSGEHSPSPRPRQHDRPQPLLPRFVSDLTKPGTESGDPRDQPVRENRA